MLTVVGEITESEVHSYQDRRTHRLAYRLDTTLSTDGPSLRMSFFAKAKHVSDWHAGRLPVGPARHLHRSGQQLPRPLAADQPDDGTVRRSDDSDETFGAAVASIKALFPLYPQTKGVDSWDLQRAIAFALTVVDDVDRPVAGRPARRARPARPDHGVPARPRPRLVGRRSPPPSGASASTRRW